MMLPFFRTALLLSQEIVGNVVCDKNCKGGEFCKGVCRVIDLHAARDVKEEDKGSIEDDTIRDNDFLPMPGYMIYPLVVKNVCQAKNYTQS